MIRNIFSGIWSYVVAAGLALALLWRVWLAGNTAQENETVRDTITLVKERGKVENSIGRMSDADVDKRLRDKNWYRSE